MDFSKFSLFVVVIALCGCSSGGIGEPVGEEGYHGEVTSLTRTRTLSYLDTDGDNKISMEEWKRSQGKDGVPPKNFYSVDKDGDGAVASDEWVTYLSERVKVGKLSDRHVEHREAEPTYLKLKLFSFPLDRKVEKEAPAEEDRRSPEGDEQRREVINGPPRPPSSR